LAKRRPAETQRTAASRTGRLLKEPAPSAAPRLIRISMESPRLIWL
jgi:hypothetical protein